MKNLTQPPWRNLADELETIGMTADTTMRLGVFFGTDPHLWLNLHKSYELEIARQKIGDNLKAIKPYNKKVYAIAH